MGRQRRRRWKRRKERAKPKRWPLMQQTRISIFIDLRILFEPMSVIFGTFRYIGIFLHCC